MFWGGCWALLRDMNVNQSSCLAVGIRGLGLGAISAMTMRCSLGLVHTDNNSKAQSSPSARCLAAK